MSNDDEDQDQDNSEEGEESDSIVGSIEVMKHVLEVALLIARLLRML